MWIICRHSYSYPLLGLYPLWSIIRPILQMEMLRHKEVTKVAMTLVSKTVHLILLLSKCHILSFFVCLCVCFFWHVSYRILFCSTFEVSHLWRYKDPGYPLESVLPVTCNIYNYVFSFLCANKNSFKYFHLFSSNSLHIMPLLTGR